MNAGAIKEKYFLWLILFIYIASLFFNSQLAPQKRADEQISVPKYVFGDGLYYLLLTENIINNGRFYIYDNINEVKGTLKLSGFSLGAGGKIYITFSPLYSILLIPAYFASGVFGAYLFNAFLGFATCYFIYRTCRLFVAKGPAVDTTIIFSLGTIIFTYSEVIYAEVLTAFLTTSAVYFTFLYSVDKTRLYIVASGLFSGMLLLAKPSLAVIPCSLIIYSIAKNRLNGIFSLAFPIALSVCLFFAYNLAESGSPLKTGYSSEIIVYDAGNSVIDHGDRIFWSNNPVKTIPGILLLMFATQPILLVSLAGIIQNWKRGEVKYVAFLSFALLFLYSLRFNPIGLWCWSTRLLTPIIPLLAVPFALAYERSQVGKNVVLILAVISIILTIFSLAPVSWHLFTQMPISNWIYYEPF